MVPGQTLGRYRITQQLGMGGLAIFYKAYDPNTEKYFVIQILRKEFSGDSEVHERFMHIVGFRMRLQHPHIISTVDYGEDAGIPYFVQQYIKGNSLKELLRKGPLPLEDVSRVLNHIASALDHAHIQGILHRDVTPMNVLLDDEGNAYLADFGVAIMIDETGMPVGLDGIPLPTGPATVGVPTYISPEQSMGHKDLTPASDVYSLGTVLYEMLTGRPPFQASTLMAVMLKKLNDPLPCLRDLRPDLPEAAEGIVYKALAKEPELRYQTAGALAAAFSQAIRHLKLPTPASTAAEEGPSKVMQLDQVMRSSEEGIRNRNNPWVSGSFYLFTAVVLMTLLAVISANVPWYALAVVFIGGLLIIIIVGALQLKNDASLGEESFLKLMIESLKRLALLRSGKSSDEANDKSESK